MTTTPETVKCKHCQCYVPANVVWEGYCGTKSACAAFWTWNPSLAKDLAESEARIAAIRRETDRLIAGDRARWRPKRNTRGSLWMAVFLIFIVIAVIGALTNKHTSVTRIKDYDPVTGKVTTETCDVIDPHGYIRPDQCTTDR